MEKVSVLQQIQSKLKAPKNQYNSFGKFHYRNQEDILEALKPILAEHGYSLLIGDKILQVGERIYVAADVVLLDVEMKQIATTSAYAREPDSKKGMDASQVTAATSSYARKTALTGMFLCDDTKDADALPPTENGFITEEQASQIRGYLELYKADKKRFLEYMDAPSVQEIPAKSYQKAMSALEAKKKAAKNDS